MIIFQNELFYFKNYLLHLSPALALELPQLSIAYNEEDYGSED